MSWDEQPATYEIRLQGRPPSWLRDRFGMMRTSPAPAQTVLFRRVDSPRDLDVLLSRLTSLGLTLAEVHEHQPSGVPADASGRTNGPCSYEVRVDGRLGESFLTFLSWRHCVVPEQTSVLVEARPEDVLQLLATCSELGLGIERVRRVSSTSSATG
ncbi:hypothetical protein HN031_15595 [Nocardioides sp. zg-1308]|uniref:hypothetical protein n=1 Tax=Nocardioides sp. zg-1308 TaxID=2736253 RepID=UPI0015539E6E|nr:hypothetical protein [Nocardioides sp. zg-1308]NPD06103.1 hypothetical protein [Nocardioides sp. zg-1308]